MATSNGKETKQNSFRATDSQLEMASDFIVTEGADGTQGKILGENISLSVIPPVTNFTPVTSNIKGYFQGVDTALGNIPSTTAGIINRIFFTGVQLTLSGGTFFTSSILGKGAVATASPTPLTNTDNQKQFFDKDIISTAQTQSSISPLGAYSISLSVRNSIDIAQQKYTVEIYKADNNGVAISSGVSGAAVGDLGVTLVTTLSSGLINLVADNLTNIILTGELLAPLSLAVGERLRYHVSAEKVGTAGGNITMEVFYGSDHNSYFDIPVTFDSDDILNRSTVPGINVTNAFDNLNANINLLFESEITDSTTVLSNIQKGVNKIYPFNKSTSQTAQINTSVYSENDVINIERRGSGTLELLFGSGVSFKGVRDIDNRFFVNDPNSIVSLMCRGSNVFSVIGNLKRGYTGAVTTSYYSSLRVGDIYKNITVLGTGFSANMKTPIFSGNATLNSWTFVNNNQITLNVTATGVLSSKVTITYDNGDIFINTDAITLLPALAFLPSDLRHYYRLETNSTDYVVSGAVNGVDTGMSYLSAFAIFNGTTSFVNLTDNNSFSYGNSTVDSDLSFSLQINPSSLGAGCLFAKRGATTNKEYSLELTSGGALRVAFYDQSTAGYIAYDFTHGWSISTLQHIAVTKSGSTVKMYINGSEITKTDISSGTYVAMENLASDLRIGCFPDSSGKFNGKIKRLGLWNKQLSSVEVASVYSEEITANNNIL